MTDVKFTPEGVKKKLKELDPSSALGPDGVWSKILHDMADALRHPLVEIFTRLLDEGGMPEVWRGAHVCLVFKKGGKGRPVITGRLVLLVSCVRIWRAW